MNSCRYHSIYVPRFHPSFIYGYEFLFKNILCMYNIYIMCACACMWCGVVWCVVCVCVCVCVCVRARARARACKKSFLLVKSWWPPQSWYQFCPNRSSIIWSSILIRYGDRTSQALYEHW